MRRLRGVLVLGALFVAACGDSTGDQPQSGDGSTNRGDSAARADGSTTGMDGGARDTGTAPRDAAPYDAYALVNWDAYFAMDPPPQTCLADGGRYYNETGVMVGIDDPTCPSDRNREGCPCPQQGMTAPCWPGLRANRNMGQCHDGMTTCRGAEFPVWGACEGAVLPDPMATRGPGACNCFSAGNWAIANTSPCFIQDASGRVLGASSSVQSGTSVSCGAARMGTGPWPPPGPTWSTSTLTVDCGGRFRVCYNLRAFADPASGMSMTPHTTDCQLSSSCVETWLTPSTPPMPQTLPPLPGWATSTAAQLTCAQQFVANGGYGEMTVLGLSADCHDINNGSGQPLVFNRVNYCPLSCSGPVAMRPPVCAMCQNGASGSF